MKSFFKTVSILLAVIMVLSSVTIPTAYAEEAYEAVVRLGGTSKYYENFEEAVLPANWFDGTTLVLLKDVETTQTIQVNSGTHTLDLNGFGIRAADSGSFSIIHVDWAANVTLTDSGDAEHKYTVGANNLAVVDDTLTGTEGEDYFTFTGGYITGGKGTDDKGGAILNDGTFTMTGGNLIGNTALRGGGIFNAGTTNFAGGQILYNYAEGWGGGIYLAEQPANTANVSGGSITYNISGNGGGIHVTDGDTLNLSGAPTVLYNTATDNTVNNINVALNGKLAVTGEIENNASIGVRRSQIYGVLTESDNTSYNDPAKFVSDVPGCVIGKDVTTGQLKLHAPYTVTWLNDNGAVLETDADVAEGSVPTYDGATPQKPNDPQNLYIFDSWTPAVATASADATYTATYRLKNPVAKVGDTLFADIETAVQAANWREGSTLTLLADIDTTQSIVVPNGAHTLDLNGFGLRAASGTNYSVITVFENAALTVADSKNTVHKYTVDSNFLATVDDNATGTEGEDYYTFTGGYITGGKGNSSCGGGINNSGTLYFTAGTIIGNSATRGAGIYNYGVSNITGGQIIHNYSNGWGGGIYLSDVVSNSVNLTGGLIKNNNANNGGGIHVSKNDTLNLSGTPKVLNNYAGANSLNNVNLTDNGMICVTGELGNNASIGVRRSQIYGVLTASDNTSYNNPQKFVSDNAACVVGKDITSGQLKLHTPYTVTWLNDNGAVLETDADAAEGSVPSYDGQPPKKPNDTQSLYAFDGWSPALATVSADATYTATYRERTPVAKVGDTLFGDIETATLAENWSAGSTLTLLANIDTTATITVPDGAHTLDLNGFGLRASGESAFSVITVPSQAQLTLTDSGDAVHKYTVGANNLAVVDDTLTGTEGEDYLTFIGGYITGGKGSGNKGGAVLNNGTFTVNGGNLMGNTALRGGAVFNAGTTNFDGGQILYNYAEGWGGGIYLAEQPANTVNVSGGTITYNMAGNGGGIHVTDGDTLNLSGAPTVLYNMVTDNTVNNINVALNGKLAVTGEIENSASIGVRRSQIYGILTASDNTSYNDPAKFVSDVPGCVIGIDITTGQLKLHAPYTVTWLGDDGELLETDTGVTEGTVPHYDGATPTKAGDASHDYSFEGWTPALAPVSADVTYIATFTESTGVARVNGTLYATFEQAVTAAETGDAVITLVADIEAPYTLSPEQTLRVELNTYGLTVNAPAGAYRLKQSTADNVTVYTAAKLYARVNNTDYESFAEAAEASGGTKKITLLRDMDVPYNIQTLSGADMLRVKAAGYTANITDYARTQTKGDFTDYFKTETDVYVDGSGVDEEDIILIAAGTVATVVVVEEAASTVVVGTGATVILDAGSNVDLDVENPEEECLQEEEQEDGSREVKNMKFHWVTIDTGISILDVGTEILPDCVNEIYATYSQNTASIIKILPPVLNIIGYTDVILKLPYPEGWFFPPIPSLPDSMDPGSHFIAFFEGSSPTSYGTPFLGKTITEDLDITGLWVPYEAAIEKPNGDMEYYLQFSDAAADADGNVVVILSAPLISYTLKKIQDSPAVYETLKVKRGAYVGNCVDAPGNLPKGYKLRSWTYKDEADETVTCYTVDGGVTPNNGVSLTLGTDITANYYIDYSAYDGAAKLVYTYNCVNEYEQYVPRTEEMDLSHIPAGALEGDRVKLTVSQAPAQMAEATHIEVQNASGEVLDALDYSAKTYCDNVIAMSDEELVDYAGSESEGEKLKTLAHSLLAYAEAAQGVFTDYVTTPVTCTSDAVKAQIEAATVTPHYIVDNAGEIKFSSIAFACTKDARLRLFLNTASATYTPPAPTSDFGNTTLKYVMRDGVKRYFVEVSGIDAVDFSKSITVTYGGSTITLSVLDYCGIVLKDGSSASTAQKQLAKALIVYNTNAQAYFG